MSFSIIVAADKNGLIGAKNQLPWRLPADLKRFKRLTLHHPVIMGRKTFEYLGKPLPERENIVLTTQKDFQPNGCTVFHSLDDLLKSIDPSKENFVIGGGEIFNLFLSRHLIHKIYYTEIDAVFEGDTYFPKNHLAKFFSSNKKSHTKKQGHPYNFSDIEYHSMPGAMKLTALELALAELNLEAQYAHALYSWWINNIIERKKNEYAFYGTPQQLEAEIQFNNTNIATYPQEEQDLVNKGINDTCNALKNKINPSILEMTTKRDILVQEPHLIKSVDIKVEYNLEKKQDL